MHFYDVIGDDTSAHSAVTPIPFTSLISPLKKDKTCIPACSCAAVPRLAAHTAVALQRRPPTTATTTQSIFIISARLRPLLPVNLRRSPLERI